LSPKLTKATSTLPQHPSTRTNQPNDQPATRKQPPTNELMDELNSTTTNPNPVNPLPAPNPVQGKQVRQLPRADPQYSEEIAGGPLSTSCRGVHIC
jgi:hypothetical protein